MYHIRKRTAIPKQKQTEGSQYRVRLDSKTVVVINRMESYLEWRRRYPNATIIH